MNSHDDFMPRYGELSDRLIDDGGDGSLGGAGTWGVAQRHIDLAFNPAGHGHTGYRTPAGDSQSEAYFFLPSYQPYQPEIPPPTCSEPPFLPPAAYIPEPRREPVRYEDGLMTPALFDWSMRSLPETPLVPFDDGI